MISLQERINAFYKYIDLKGIRNKEVVNLTGFTRGAVSNILTKKINPSENFLNTFEESLKIDLNEYIASNNETTEKVTKFEIKEKLIEKMELFKPIPYYNINVSAGNVTFLDDGLLENQNPDDFMFVPKNIDADIAFPTFGHSMYPEISNGDRVAYKLIKDWSFFNYGMKYLIITDEQRMVKYLKKHEKEGYVLLESRNKEFQPIDMPISSIRAILQVRYIGKIEM